MSSQKEIPATKTEMIQNAWEAGCRKPKAVVEWVKDEYGENLKTGTVNVTLSKIRNGSGPSHVPGYVPTGRGRGRPRKTEQEKLESTEPESTPPDEKVSEDPKMKVRVQVQPRDPDSDNWDKVFSEEQLKEATQATKVSDDPPPLDNFENALKFVESVGDIEKAGELIDVIRRISSLLKK